MRVKDLINMFELLTLADKADQSEFLFNSSAEGMEPFPITGVRLDQEGDVCLESDYSLPEGLSAASLAAELEKYDEDKMIYFIHIDEQGQEWLFNIKDGGTKDRHSSDLLMLGSRTLTKILEAYSPEAILHFESGTVNFTINSIYTDPQGCLCLESNEVMELDDYPLSLIIEELHAFENEVPVYFYDDDSKEYYGIYPDEMRLDNKGDIWITVR